MHAICTLTPPAVVVHSSKAVGTALLVATAAQQNGSKSSEDDRQNALKPQTTNTQRRFPPILQHLASFPLIRATRRTLSTFMLSPVFTPRATFARWRTQRAIRAATRAARVKDKKRDWQNRFRLNGLTWHHVYISQDLNRIAFLLRELQRNLEPRPEPRRMLRGKNPNDQAKTDEDKNNKENEKDNKSESSGSSVTPFTPVSIPVTGATLVHLERSYAFMLDNVFDVYNSLEKHVLFPWIINGVDVSSLSSANSKAVQVPSKDKNNDKNKKKNDKTESSGQIDMEKYIALQRAMSLFSTERARIEDRADMIRSRFARVVCSTGFPYTYGGPCNSSSTFNSASRLRREKRRGETVDARARAAALKDGGEEDDKEVARRRRSSLYIRTGYLPLPVDDEERKSLQGYGKKKIEDTAIVNCTSTSSFKWRTPAVDDMRALHADLATLIEDTERLHRTERKLLYPIIANVFSEQEQNRLTNVMVYSMRSALAKLLITVYQQSVEKQASRAQWRFYKREVPLPIRVYTPVWRARLYDGSPLGWLRNTSLKDMRESPLAVPAQP